MPRDINAMFGSLFLSSLNLTDEVFRFFAAAGLCWGGAIIGGIKGFKARNLPLAFLSMMLAGVGFSAFFEGCAGAFLVLTYRHLSILCLVLATLGMLLFSDFVAHESLNPFKLTLWGILSALLLYVQFQPGMDLLITEEGVSNFARQEPLKSLVSMLMGYHITLYVLWGISTWIKAPPSLRKSAIWLVGGLVLAGALLGMAHLFWEVTGNYLPLIIGIAGLFNIIILILEPSLLFVLPFKAYRLLVLAKHSGLALYDHRWTKDTIDEDLLSGLISAIKSMGEDVLQKGGIKEITWEKGILLFHLGQTVNVALLTSKKSSFLITSVAQFTEAFETRFRDTLRFNPQEMSAFRSTETLVREIFPHIPRE